MREKHAFFRALSAWIGFRTAYVDFDVRERMAGTSKWSVRALTRYAINSISSFSTVPMQFATVLGTLMLLVSIILGVTALVQACSGHAPEGYTLVIFVQLLSSSLILISLGIIGYSILSYILNRKFTFRSDRKTAATLPRFIAHIAVCYLLAYGIAKPAAAHILSGCSQPVQENVAMLVGMCLFVGLNYLGQRFFVFRARQSAEKQQDSSEAPRS